MAATSAQPPPGSAGQPQPGGPVVSSNGDPELATSDEVKEYCHEGEGEKTEHQNSMDLHDIKTELEKDAEESEVSPDHMKVLLVQNHLLYSAKYN